MTILILLIFLLLVASVFIADWEDEYCTLTFDELVDTLKIPDESVEIAREPNLEIK